MKLVGRDPVVLDITADEAVQLGYVAMLMLWTGSPAPCEPSHWFCAATENVPDKALLRAYDGKGKNKKWWVAASRRIFRYSAICPDVDPDGFTGSVMAEWVNAALARPDISDDAVPVLHDLARELGGRVRLDA